jgi:glycosyltransferase involved in cell wall biosynthesis
MMSHGHEPSLRVSVIICTYKRSESLSNALHSLATMSVPRSFPWELLVVDNNSPDNTAEVVDSFRARETHVPLKYVFEPVPGLSCARNRGIRESRGEILAFLDDDVRVAQGWLIEVVRAFDEFDVACVGGRVLLDDRIPRPLWWDHSYDVAVGEFDRGSEVIIDQSEETLIGIGANIMFKRTAVEQCGWFRIDMGRKANQLTTGEETDMVQRLRHAGYPVMYYPHALVYHCVPRERFTKPYLRQHFYNSGQWYFLQELKEPGMEPRILGVPRWRYRSVLEDIGKSLRLLLSRRPVEYFLHQLRVVFFWGYVRAAQRARGVHTANPVDRSGKPVSPTADTSRSEKSECELASRQETADDRR